MIAAALALAAATPAAARPVDAVVNKAGFAGEVLVAKGGKVLLDQGYGTIAPGGGAPHRAGERWRLASITKQVTATLLMAEQAAGRLSLDRPVAATFGQPALGAVTTRQLLTHHSGLANPDETPAGADGVPSFYRAAPPRLGYCFSRAAVPGAPFSYNNCDYLVAAMSLAGGERHWPKGMAMAAPGRPTVPGFVKGRPEPAFDLASFGAAGGLTGTARALLDFDRALMTGKLLPPAALAELWRPEGKGSYQALGQWVFPGQLKGCAAPKRIVQRDGEIFGVQARNYIFPDDDLVVILLTNRSADDFRLGEVWEQSGFVYDLLSAAACS